MFISTVIEVGYAKYWVVCPNGAVPKAEEWAVVSDWSIPQTLIDAAGDCGAAPRKAEFGSGLSYRLPGLDPEKFLANPLIRGMDARERPDVIWRSDCVGHLRLREYNIPAQALRGIKSLNKELRWEIDTALEREDEDWQKCYLSRATGVLQRMRSSYIAGSGSTWVDPHLRDKFVEEVEKYFEGKSSVL